MDRLKWANSVSDGDGRDRKAVCSCDACRTPILKGDRYVNISNMGCICMDCVKNNTEVAE